MTEEETFVQLIYPSDGLNWLQGENGPLGLPDIRAQAGFIAEDGRFFDLDGSGTSAVSFILHLSYFPFTLHFLYPFCNARYVS